ncbi:hypothetical protein O0L34_g294 [Tuta absoluta]|nr:hypothetical protein O0L34_g294 [Tuta absoluta]
MGQWEVEGRSFLITGGASGLGALYAEAFLKEGAKLVAIADIAEDIGQATAARLNNTFKDKVVFFKCDVSSEENIAATFDQVVAKLGRVDVLINNAGVMSDNPKVWRKACDINWQGSVSFTMRGQKHMRQDECGAGGTIINIASTAALNAFAHIPIYAGSKAAVLHFSYSLSRPPFYEQTGVRIIIMCIGATDTPLVQGLKERAYTESMGQILEDFFAQDIVFQKPESAAAACVKAFKEGGENGSVWLAVNNNVGKDITPLINKHIEDYAQLLSHVD